jgi:diguanylate cyclase (GGDEF)-like protein
MDDDGQQLRSALTGVMLGLGAVGMGRALRDAIRERDEARLRTFVLKTAVDELIATLEPDQVIASTVRLAAEMASPPGRRAQRANYCRIVDGTVQVQAERDPEGDWLGASWQLEEHPHMAEAVRTRLPRSGRIDPAELGPAVRAVNRSQGVGHGGWIPVVVDDELHGVLAIGGRNRPVTDHELSRGVAIAQITQLALSRALTHQSLRRDAFTDPLTSLANRRGLETLVRDQRMGRPLAALAIDIDGLKTVNDQSGHSAGDELLVTVADALSAVMRSGDIAARVGGDEFVCVAFDAAESAGSDLAKRMLEALNSISVHNHLARASIGVAYAVPHVSLADAIRRADTAMYDAKRAGGMRYRFAGPTLRLATAANP